MIFSTLYDPQYDTLEAMEWIEAKRALEIGDEIRKLRDLRGQHE
jgi:hypothetical protein